MSLKPESDFPPFNENKSIADQRRVSVATRPQTASTSVHMNVCQGTEYLVIYRSDYHDVCDASCVTFDLPALIVESACRASWWCVY